MTLTQPKRDRDVAQRLLDRRCLGAYVGIDPTAPSLHLGHLLPLMPLFWLYLHGHRVVSLVGSATAEIGDPSGRLTTREQMEDNSARLNSSKMLTQVTRLWKSMEELATRRYGFKQEKRQLEILENSAWLRKLNIIDFLSTVGRGSRVGAMIGRDTARNKMEHGDGLSFAEFTYPLLQAWDWWHMYRERGIQMQIGGSDQFGNIISGIDSVNYCLRAIPQGESAATESSIKPMGFTVPLLTTPSGQKIGKSAGNAIWLDEEITPPFELYRYLMGIPDATVESMLKLYTFIPLIEIERIVEENAKATSKRITQRRLAQEVVELVHGPEVADAVTAQHRSYFQTSRIEGGAKTADASISRSALSMGKLSLVLRESGIVESSSQAKRLIEGGGVYVLDSQSKWRKIITDEAGQLDGNLLGDMITLRLGKSNVKALRVTTDS